MIQSKNISILGSTGSIGSQALQVIDKLGNYFRVNYLTTNKNISLLEDQISKFHPKAVVIADEKSFYEFKSNTLFKGKILLGDEGIIEAASSEDNDLLLSSLVGFAGVNPTLAALKKGINVALANKETLVSAGELITQVAKANNAEIIAVDSEHNAILQCLIGEKLESIEKLILTASGGPFLKRSIDDFMKFSVEDALNHPNWSMGSKITIDSATMMNKGFEFIEAYWLFGCPLSKIEVVVHPQSIIHSMVQFTDGSIKAQLGLPDMRVPISYALTYPDRFEYDFPRLDITEIGKLEFFKPDLQKFQCLQLAMNAIEKGGNVPAILNAANEIAVKNFLEKKINFGEIPNIINNVIGKMSFLARPDLMSIINSDLEARRITEELITNN